MRPARNASLATLLLLAALTSAATAADDVTVEQAGPMPVDLTGVWNLDAIASDDLAGQLEELRESLLARVERSRPGQGTGGEEPGVGVPARRGSPGRRDVAPQNVDGPRDLARAMEQLLITVDGGNLEIMDGTDHTRIWTPGGRPVQRDGPGGQVIEQAWWEGDVLVLATNGGPLATTRRLHLEDDGKTLAVDVTVKVSGTAERVDARVVYTGY